MAKLLTYDGQVIDPTAYIYMRNGTFICEQGKNKSVPLLSETPQKQDTCL